MRAVGGMVPLRRECPVDFREPCGVERRYVHRDCLIREAKREGLEGAFYYIARPIAVLEVDAVQEMRAVHAVGEDRRRRTVCGERGADLSRAVESRGVL